MSVAHPEICPGGGGGNDSRNLRRGVAAKFCRKSAIFGFTQSTAY